jgi:hypothetical protein
LSNSAFGYGQTTIMGILHTDLHLFSHTKVMVGNPYPRDSHVGNSPAIHKGKILTNVPELLCCVHKSQLVMFLLSLGLRSFILAINSYINFSSNVEM